MASSGVPAGGLLEEWLQKLKENGKLTGSSTDEFEKLSTWLVDRQESNEVAGLCKDVGKLVRGANGGVVFYLQNLCKGIAEIKYFISGVKKVRKYYGAAEDNQATIEKLTDDKAYPRCIVGTLALSALYGDHCYSGAVMDHLKNDVKVENKIKDTHKDAIANLGICKKVTNADLMFAKSLLQSTIEQRTQQERKERQKNENWRIYWPWSYRPSVCKQPAKAGTTEHEAGRKKILQDNKKSLVEFTLGKNTQSGSNASSTMEDILVNDDYTISGDTLTQALSSAISSGNVDVGKAIENVTKAAKKTEAEVCMKQEGQPFCQRLECAEKHWNLTKGQGNTDNFWNNYVKNELGNLFNRAAASDGGTGGAHCKNASLDGANKEACKHITAKLDIMYRNSKGKHKLSDQIINCLLINAYAKKLNEQAKQRGYCDIGKGIQEAFNHSKTIIGNTSGPCGTGTNGNNCIECKWQESDYENCTIKATDNAAQTENVKSKVESMLNNNRRTKDSPIQKILAEFNKENTLCERINCAANWYKDTKTSGQGNFWEKNGAAVATLWKDLAGAMEKSKGIGNSDCDHVQDGTTASPSDRTACNYLYAGLQKLYEKPDASAGAPAPAAPALSSPDDGILSKNNPSFRQTMGCFLLHAYAKEMKKKSICNIDKGISTAFELGEKLRSSGTCNGGAGSGKGPCVPCQWEQKNFQDCEIKTNGSTDPNYKVENKLKDIVKESDPAVTAAAQKMNEVKDLCKRFQCISEKWLKDVKNKGQNGQNLTKDDWNDVWNEVKAELTELGSAINSNKSTVGTYCSKLGNHTDGRPRDKEACLRIAAGLKSLYDIQDNDKPVKASFKRTMRCVLLNAIADKMKNELPCERGRSVTEGIDKAFKKSNDIMKESEGCKNNDNCFTCERFTGYKNCTFKENSRTAQLTELKKKIDPKLEDSNISSSFTKDSLMRTICGGQCKNMSNLCGRVECVKKQWFDDRGYGTTDTTKADEIWKEVQKQITELDKNIGKNNDDSTDSLCAAVQCTNGNADDCVSKTTCKLIVKALKNIHEMKENGSGSEGAKLNDRIFRSTMRCAILNAFIHTLKEHARNGGYGCAVEKGIKEAFSKGEEEENREKWCKKNGKEDGSCEACEERLCFGSKIGKADKLWDEVMKKLNTDINTKIQPTLSKIKEKVTLCDRVNCIASRVKAKGNEDKFWKTDGEVANLWKDLSEAMKVNGGKDDNGGQCDQMDDNGTAGAKTRPATDPEKKACQYLSAGFKKLRENSSSNRKDGKLLSSSSLRQTMGCFLLHAYANEMKNKSICVIDAGIKRAFKNAGSCNGKRPCVPCHWNEADYDKCQITTTGTNGNTTKSAKDKLKHVQDNINSTAEDNLKKINRMDKLCDYIKCAGPKWFKNKNGGNGNPTQTWCDFWEYEGVKPKLQDLFEKIKSGGQDTNDVCNKFGDGNEDSVERKACNHITAGLQYIKDIQPNGSGGSGQDNQLLQRAVGCIALNMYADQIIKSTDNVCPMDETKISKMFEEWNKSNSLCNGVSNNNGCFECKREANFGSCNLLVDKDLIGTSTVQNANCNDNDDNKDVQKQMKELLEDKSQSNSTIKSNITTTLTTITNMTSSFCTQLQCAAKKWGKTNNKANSNGSVSWDALRDEIEKELKALLENMTEGQTKSEITKYCNDREWGEFGHKGKHTNKAACLLFASGLKHIYTHGNGRGSGQVNGPSFGQTMGCLFLKEYAKQLIDLADKEKKYKVHPLCEIDKGIDHAFSKSEKIMKDTSPCNKNGNSCFECKWNDNDYDDCKIGNDKVKTNVETLFKHDENKKHMQQTLENTVCPILLTDILTPFLPLAPVSIGLSAMAYYLWKYFGPLGKGGPRFRRSPTEIPGSSVQEQVLNHVQQDSSHEYRLVKERKPRSVPTGTKRSGRVNRRTIIEIHFEVLDECQKGDTQLAQKDFLELLVQEFMGSEFMEEEQVPLERVPIEELPSLGSGLLV
eukprot:XP_002261218.1 SICA antigen [Plasmodium knowlesi strain H]